MRSSAQQLEANESPAATDFDADILSKRYVNVPRGDSHHDYSEAAVGTDTSPAGDEITGPGRHPVAAAPMRLPAQAPLSYRFSLLQQWEGIVRDVGSNDFIAELRDLSDPAQPLEEATFNFDEVSDDDRALILNGAVFLWSIGYRTRHGQKERVSLIRFLRLPAWSARAVERVKRRAAVLEKAFGAS